MTIAACHVSPEGVVLGADSTTTIASQNGKTRCHFDHAQKLFEVGGPDSLVGMVTWGLGSIGPKSHRSIASDLGKVHKATPFASMKDMADSLGQTVWSMFSTEFGTEIAETQRLLKKMQDGDQLNEQELERLEAGIGLRGGYCIAGRVEGEDECSAFTVLWDPRSNAADVQPVAKEVPIFWGVPQFVERLIWGFDSEAIAAILSSGKWSGTDRDLIDILMGFQLINPQLLPLREAIDWIHTVIHTTIRAIKFAKQPHLCGGPIEIAVVTSDRPFRWVQHKTLNSAIGRESR